MMRLTSPAAFSVTVIAMLRYPFLSQTVHKTPPDGQGQTKDNSLTGQAPGTRARTARTSGPDAPAKALPVHLVGRAQGAQVVDHPHHLPDDEVHLLLGVEPAEAEADAAAG